MKTEPLKNNKVPVHNDQDYSKFPFDGFVDVNAIVERRRRLRSAEFFKGKAGERTNTSQTKEG